MIVDGIKFVLFDLQETEFIVWNPVTSGNTVYLEKQMGIKLFGICIFRIVPVWLIPLPLPHITYDFKHFLKQR